jgi:hypothetical protein
MFGNTPAHGLLIRHAQGIEINDYKVIAASGDARPCFLLDGAERVDFLNIQTDRAEDTPIFILDKVKDFSVVGCKSLPDTRIAEANHKEL